MAAQRKDRGDMAWLLRTTNSMLRCRSVTALLDLAYDAVRDGLGYDRVGLVLVDYERRLVVERIGTDEDGRKFYPHGRAWSFDDGSVHLSLLTDARLQPAGPGFIYLANAARDLPASARRYLDGQPRHTLRVALRTPDKVLGLISVDNLISGRPIRPRDAPPLLAFANALASALENITLLEERARRIDHLDADLRQRVEQLTWLQEAGSRLALARDLDEVLDTTYSCVRDGLGYDRVGIILIEAGDDGRPVLHEVRGTDELGQPTRGRPDGPALDDPDLAIHSPDAFALQQGHTFYYCPDRWAATPPEHREGLEGRMREQLAVASRHDGSLVGYISVDNLLSTRPIVEADAAPLVAFAAHAALAISRARVLMQEQAARAEAEKARVAAEAQARQIDAIFESVGDGIFVFDRDGAVLHMNTAARQLLALEAPPSFYATPLSARGYQTVVQDEQDQPLHEQQWPFMRVLQGEVLTGACAVDLTVRRRDGQERILNVSGAPVRAEAGGIAGAVCVVRDVTERRRLERHTREALHALLAMAEALVAAAPASAEDGEWERSSQVVGQRLVELTRQLLGCERVSIWAVDPETLARHLVAVVGLAPERERALVESIGLDDPRIVTGEVVALEMTPPSYPAMANARRVLVVPLHVGQTRVGVLSYDYGAAEHDVTREESALAAAIARLVALALERERLLRLRAEARASELALREANRRMDEFLSIASHELKTPLTALKGSIQLAERRLARQVAGAWGEGGDPVAALQGSREMLRLTMGQVERMERLANDLVDVSRIQAGHLGLRLAPCDLANVVRTAVEEQRGAHPGRTIVVDIPQGRAVPVHVDADRIDQVVTNYLTNALKYSEADRPVAVGLEVAGGTARVWVRDDGPGIALSEQEHIWERFYRAPGIAYRSGSGIGLGMGLYISRTIVERHGGQVGVESRPGSGATFWFTVPLTPTVS